MDVTRCCDVASPRPWTSPSNQSYTVNSTVVIECLSDSHPTPTFSWRRHGAAVTSSDRLRVDPVAGQLVIYSAADSDAGPWECVAVNERGEATTVARLHLIGQTPPVSVVVIIIITIIIVVFVVFEVWSWSWSKSWS